MKDERSGKRVKDLENRDRDRGERIAKGQQNCAA
jgi:hypothetical protein